MQERGDMATGVVRALAFVGVLVVSLLFGMGLVMVLADAMSSDRPDVAPIELVTTTTVVDTVPPTTEVDPTLAPPTAGTASVPDPTPPPPPPPPPAPAPSPPPPPPPRPAPAPPPVAPDDDDDDFDDDDDDFDDD